MNTVTITVVEEVVEIVEIVEKGDTGESGISIDYANPITISVESGGFKNIELDANKSYLLTDVGADAATLVTYTAGTIASGSIFHIRVDPSFGSSKILGIKSNDLTSFIKAEASLLCRYDGSPGAITTLAYFTSNGIMQALFASNSASFANPVVTFLDFETARAYVSEGSSEPIFLNESTPSGGVVEGTYVFDYENGNAHKVTFTAVDCDLSWTNLPTSGNLGSVWFETTTGGTLPSTLGGTSSPDWQIELLSLLAINSTQTFELWSRDGSTVRINEFEYSGQ